MFFLSSRQSRGNRYRRYVPTVKVRRASCLLICTLLVLGPFLPFCPISRAEIPLPSQQTSRKEIALPTPMSHYETFKPGTSGLPLLLDLLKEFEPETQKVLLRFAIASGLQDIAANPELASADLKKLQSLAEEAGLPKQPPIPKEQAIALIKRTNWADHRPILLEFFLHQSQVLEMIPDKWGSIWAPIVHDALLYFLDHLSDDRLLDKLVSLAYLPPGSSRGDYLKEFVSKVPSLQKMGQILARNPDLSPDYRKALQDLENGIHTMTREELVTFITEDVGKPSIDKYQVQFEDKILAEASVGAVIRASTIPPGGTVRRQAICKVVKPYVLAYMPEDLSIINGLASYFTVNHDFYQLGSMPLVEIFQELGKSLTNEIDITDEQQNFIRAREYYRNSKKVVVPEIFPLSTKHVTFMEFIAGEKITSAFPGDTKQRAIMARRLSDIMTGDVIFSSKSEAIFHGDPHPGNVNRVTSDPKNPYKIALLDWGLMGTFPRQDRVGLMQLILGVQLADAKRVHNNLGTLLDQGLPTSPEKLQKIDALIAETIKPKEGRSSFDAMQELLFGLIEQGYKTKFNLNIFIKSQLTIAGELVELDPTLKQDELLEKQVTALVMNELPKRLLCTIFCWNSRNYQSLLSNADVMDARRKPKKPKEAKAPPPVKTVSKLRVQVQH
jgi:ubiquinone biosynthesis protein